MASPRRSWRRWKRGRWRRPPAPWEAFVEGRDHFSGDDFIRTGGLDDASPDMYVSLAFRDRPGPVPAPPADGRPDRRLRRADAELMSFTDFEGGVG